MHIHGVASRPPGGEALVPVDGGAPGMVGTGAATARETAGSSCQLAPGVDLGEARGRSPGTQGGGGVLLLALSAGAWRPPGPPGRSSVGAGPLPCESPHPRGGRGGGEPRVGSGGNIYLHRGGCFFRTGVAGALFASDLGANRRIPARRLAWKRRQRGQGRFGPSAAAFVTRTPQAPGGPVARSRRERRGVS